MSYRIEQLLRRCHKRAVERLDTEVITVSTAFVLIKTKPMMESQVYQALLALDNVCLLHTSDAADDLLRVGLGGRHNMKKK